jgi:hypothetical protein
MHTRTASLLVAATVAVVVALVPVMAQQERMSPEPEKATGTLVRVDTDMRTVSIRTAAGADLAFSYNDQTVVSGDEQTVAGLATLSGTDVTVHFTKNGEDRIASKIEVKKKDK